MKKYSFLLFLFSILIISSCKKEVGSGGTSTIRGRVFGYDINSSGIVLDSAYVGDVRVYLSYGDNAWPDEDERTSYTGDYAFQGLQKGKYKVFVFTQCVTCPFDQASIVKEVEITENGQTIVLPDFKIKD